MSYLKLYIKELRFVIPSVALFIVMMLALQAWVHTNSTQWDTLGILIPAVCLPLLWLLLWVMIIAYLILYTEWKHKSIYMVMSLPLRGWKLISAKLSAVFSGAAAITVTGGLSVWLLFKDTILSITPSSSFAVMDEGLVMGIVLFVAVLVLLTNTVMLTYLVSRLFRQYPFIIFTCLLFCSFWVLYRLTGMVSPLLSWLPVVEWQSPEAGVFSYSFGTPLIILLLSGLLFAISCWVYEMKLEVE
ncbi:hypothetical protein AB6A23_00340 [Paenibacillus tarimensis]